MSTSTFQCLAGGLQAHRHRQVQTLTHHLPLLPPTPLSLGSPRVKGSDLAPRVGITPVSSRLPADLPHHQPLDSVHCSPPLLLPSPQASSLSR